MDNKTIFIAEDDYDFLEQTKLYLAKEGFRILAARNDAEALKIIANEDFDLAILDLMIDNQDSGFVLGYKIKKKNPQIPVILVTAVTKETGYRFDLSEKGDKSWIKADAILNKNIRYEQLMREIKRLL